MPAGGLAEAAPPPKSAAAIPMRSRASLGNPRNSSGVKNLLDPALLQVHDPVRQIHQIIEPVLRDQNGLALLLKQPQMAF